MPLPSVRFARSDGAAVLAGLGYGLALPAWPGLELGWLAWFALLPMLRDPQRPPDLKACLWFSFAGSLAGGCWVLGYHPVIGALAVAWHTLLLLLPWLGYRALAARLGVPAARWLLPALWVACEWGESRLQPFFWGTFGTTQAGLLPVAQAADLFGVWGLSFWVVALNVLLVQALEARGARRRWTGALALWFAAPWLYGLWVLHGAPERPASGAELRVALVRSGFDPQTSRPDAARAIELTTRAQALGADLVVWPESLFPRAPFWNEEFRAAQAWHTPVLLPYNREQLDRQSVSALLWTPVLQRQLAREGSQALDAVPQYEKRALIPWTERRLVPDALARWLFWAHGIWLPGLRPGAGPALLPLATRDGAAVRLGPLVCYEVAFPELAADQTRAGAEVLVLMSNEAPYGPTLHWQSLMMARLRAIETRRPLLRANTRGHVGLIDVQGRLVRTGTGPGEGVVEGQVRGGGGLSFYVRHPALLSSICLIMLLIATLWTACSRVRARRIFVGRNSGRGFS